MIEQCCDARWKVRVLLSRHFRNELTGMRYPHYGILFSLLMVSDRF